MIVRTLKKPQTSKKISAKINFSSDDLVSIYITLRILTKIKDDLGLEAMLEYINCYLFGLETTNQYLRQITTQVLEIMDIEEIYQEVKQR